MAKVLITCKEPDIETNLSECFGKSEYFCIYDSVRKKYDFFENPANKKAKHKGRVTIKYCIDNGINTIISGDFGPVAKTLLEEKDIQLVIFRKNITVKEILSINKIKLL